MTVPAIGSLQQPLLDGANAVGGAGKAVSTEGFGEMLRGKLEELTASQVTGEQAAGELATGRVDDLARTMLRVEQANISLQMATQLRNKAIDAYQEILRMQI